MTARYLKRDDLPEALSRMVGERTLYGPLLREEELHLARISPRQAQVSSRRMVEPLKSLFFRPREDLGGIFGKEDEMQAPRRAVLGASACDLVALSLLDWVFLEGDFIDEYYRAMREDTLIISADCTEPKESCFCTFFGRTPWPEEGYDINLAAAGEGGWVVETAGERGAEALERADLPPADEEQLGTVERRRNEVRSRVEQNTRRAGLTEPNGLQERVRGSRGEPLWYELAEKCVECAGCNFICPTCHCFVLTDLQAREGARRFKHWDACLYAGFALEASGVNPRARRAERLQGRLEKKLDFIPANTDQWGCTGCGRCIEACAGELDVRETINALLEGRPAAAGAESED